MAAAAAVPSAPPLALLVSDEQALRFSAVKAQSVDEVYKKVQDYKMNKSQFPIVKPSNTFVFTEGERVYRFRKQRLIFPTIYAYYGTVVGHSDQQSSTVQVQWQVEYQSSLDLQILTDRPEECSKDELRVEQAKVCQENLYNYQANDCMYEKIPKEEQQAFEVMLGKEKKRLDEIYKSELYCLMMPA